MIIQESDFKIVKEDKCFVLYILKNKKEIKENEKSLFKIEGYYISLLSAFKSALRFRQDKKYPGKESSADLSILIKIYENSNKDLENLSKSIYQPILELKQKLINYERYFSSI